MPQTSRTLKQEWDTIRALLQPEFSDDSQNIQIEDTKVIHISQGKVVLHSPSPQAANRMQALYGDKIRRLWKDMNGAVRELQFLHHAAVAPMRLMPEKSSTSSHDSTDTAYALDVSDIPDAVSVASSSPLDPRFTFDNFVVGRSNEFAYAAARRVADSPNVTFNPLFLHGGVGLGKTHLMHAIAWEISRKTPARNVLYLSAEKFMYRFIRALRFKDTVGFKEQFRSVDVLMIDDVQFISGKDSTQEEFFHTFNALIDTKKQIILSADKSPSDLVGIEDRLKSRLGWGLVADIHDTDYELRYGILQTKANQLGVDIPESVLNLLAQRITSNVRELEGALNRLVAHAEFVNRKVTVETAQDTLRDLLRTSMRRIDIDAIQKDVCEHFALKLVDMSSSRRSRNIARPRQIAMYLCKILTTASLPEIGRKFGGRDHTTVMHAVKTIEKLIDEDASLAEDVALLKRRLA